jgi:hypothetical protein
VHLGRKGKWEYFRAIYARYQQADRQAKQVMLDEFCLTTGYHRKYAIRILNGPPPALLLAERGAKVVLGARGSDRLEALAARAQAGGEAAYARTDVALEAAQVLGRRKPASGLEFGLDAWLMAVSTRGEPIEAFRIKPTKKTASKKVPARESSVRSGK